MNLLPVLLIILTGAVIAKGMTSRKKMIMVPGGGTTPEGRVANLRAHLALAFQEGDTAKYIKIQKELELAELATGL